MREELKPCPFCGGEAKLVTGTSSMVECQNDQCIIGDPAPFNDFSHRADAVAAWNTRATPSQRLDAATVERVRIIAEARRNLRLTQGCLECNAEDERRWIDTITWLESLA